MIIEKGKLVVYTASHGDAEIGFVHSVSDHFVFVRYWDPLHQRFKETAQATKKDELTPADNDDLICLFELRSEPA